MDAVIISGPQNGIYLPKASYGRGCPILRIDDFQEGWVRGRDELNKVTGDPETLKVYQLRVGDLIINRVNSPSHLGKCLVVRASLVPAVFESNMMRAALSGLIHARYIEFYLRSVDGRSRLNSNAKWAVNQASINQQDVKSTGLPLPPFPEQQRIVAEVERRLSVVEELEAVAGANVQRVTRLRQSILQQAFNGSLVCAGLTNSKTGVIENPRVQA
jgi:type I restriction enzyme S subunit